MPGYAPKLTQFSFKQSVCVDGNWIFLTRMNGVDVVNE